MGRGARGGSRPPAWAWAVMVVQALVLAVVIPYAVTGEPASPAPRAEPDRSSAVPRPEPTQPPVPVRVLVIGDSYTVGSGEGGLGRANWTQVVTAELGPVTLDVAAEGGRGYVSTGPAGGTFLDLAERADVGYDVVLVFGSRNDRGSRADIREAAARIFAVLRESSPAAELLVIGPPWVDASPPSGVVTSSRAVEAAARAAGATFIDPLAEGWFTGGARRLIGEDRIHPTDTGHRYLARRIAPSLGAAVDRARS